MSWWGSLEAKFFLGVQRKARIFAGAPLYWQNYDCSTETRFFPSIFSNEKTPLMLHFPIDVPWFSHFMVDFPMPSGNLTYIAIENGHLQLIYPLRMEGNMKWASWNGKVSSTNVGRFERFECLMHCHPNTGVADQHPLTSMISNLHEKKIPCLFPKKWWNILLNIYPWKFPWVFPYLWWIISHDFPMKNSSRRFLRRVIDLIAELVRRPGDDALRQPMCFFFEKMELLEWF